MVLRSRRQTDSCPRSALQVFHVACCLSLESASAFPKQHVTDIYIYIYVCVCMKVDRFKNRTQHR